LSNLINEFSLESNQLSGSLPAQIGNLAKITGTFGLAHNAGLNGCIPDAIRTLSQSVTTGWAVSAGELSLPRPRNIAEPTN